MRNYWRENGDMVASDIVLRQVGWIINGGANDGLMVKEITEEHKKIQMGGYSPLYIEVGD